MSKEQYKMTEKPSGLKENPSTGHKVFRTILIIVGVVLVILALMLFFVVA